MDGFPIGSHWIVASSEQPHYQSMSIYYILFLDLSLLLLRLLRCGRFSETCVFWCPDGRPSWYHGTGFPSWSKAKMRDELTGKRRFQEEEIPESVTATETRHDDWRLRMAPLHVWLYARISCLFPLCGWCMSIRYILWYCCFCHGSCVLGMLYCFTHFFVQSTVIWGTQICRALCNVYPVVQRSSVSLLLWAFERDTWKYIWIYLILSGCACCRAACFSVLGRVGCCRNHYLHNKI